VNQYKIPYLIEKELTDLEKDRIIEMAWEDRTTFETINAIWFKRTGSNRPNAFGNEIEFQNVA
jgi:hypothetical protein